MVLVNIAPNVWSLLRHAVDFLPMLEIGSLNADNAIDISKPSPMDLLSDRKDSFPFSHQPE